MRSIYREEPCLTAMTTTPGSPFGWTLNPYMGCVHRCTFCYVRAFEARADRPSDDLYGESIRVKTNVVQVLTRELAKASWKRERVVIGAATDPYQPAEGRYRLTRGCIEALSRYWTPINIITRGPLVVRDADVLAEAAERVGVSVAFSIGTLDEGVWRTTEPGTAPPAQRLRALSMLRKAGIQAGVSLAPIMPGLNDRPEQLEAVVSAARDAGAAFIFGVPLHLKDGTREHFLGKLAQDWPTLLPRYEELYQRPYLRDADARPLGELVDALKTAAGITGDKAPEPPLASQSLRQLSLI